MNNEFDNNNCCRCRCNCEHNHQEQNRCNCNNNCHHQNNDWHREDDCRDKHENDCRGRECCCKVVERKCGVCDCLRRLFCCGR